ncbi:single-stranded DNA-binding protein [Dyadobacter sp. CY345]|uniref:single-stranded DNA-binding protein n=1 Tax=Dyadobacter sp. CY345 TaxID=2909335 RepID=UPI001F4437EE|nr:single-stranded DNA-binding protein [Dyadobacter sp. CY345]MCF2443296.1 single-stranded DNA-binding protein [Dyadobacter sp. CY345]
MEIVARLVSDANVSQTKSGRKVVKFTVAINDYYKPKNGEGVQTTTYVACNYWISEAIAPRLLKGVLVELSGRLGVEAYINKSGEAVGVINFQVNRIKLHSPKSKGDTASASTDLKSRSTATNTCPVGSDDDLPF